MRLWFLFQITYISNLIGKSHSAIRTAAISGHLLEVTAIDNLGEKQMQVDVEFLYVATYVRVYVYVENVPFGVTVLVCSYICMCGLDTLWCGSVFLCMFSS